MPLLQATPPSSIGSVYLTGDATSSGAWCLVEWTDWSSRTKKVKTNTPAWDGTPHLSTAGVGAKGQISLRIPSCTSTLYSSLLALANTRTHYTATLKHAQLGTVSREVEVVDVVSLDDNKQDIAGDPVENVTVRLMSFGVAP